MQQSRVKRRERQKKRRRKQFFLTAAGLAASAALAVCAWWLWSGKANALLSGLLSAEGAEPEPVEIRPAPPRPDPPIRQEGDGGAGQPPEGGEQLRVRLAFVGDILLGGNVEKMMMKHGYDYPYAHVSGYLQSVDIAAGNLENPVTSRGTPQEKQFVFRASPDAVPALAESGFDLLSLANNHSLDYGPEGLKDTAALLDRHGLRYVGAGADAEEAFRPVIVEKNGIKVAYLGFSRVIPDTSWHAGKNRPGLAGTYDVRKPAEAIAKAAEEADLVVVLVHWGVERMSLPEKYQQQLGRQYIDAGADLVVGSHPHVLQGFETYKGKWIAYSLGNFIFTVGRHAATAQTAILEADCGAMGDCLLTVKPHHAGAAQPYPMGEEESRQLYARLSEISYNAVVDDGGGIRPADGPAADWESYWEKGKSKEEPE